MTQPPSPPNPDQQPPQYGPPTPGYSYQPPPGYRQVGADSPLPTIWPTLLITLFFGLFGLIPAIMHTNRARDTGRPTNNYWITFGCTMVGGFLLWFVLLLILGAASTPTTTYYR